MSKLVNYANEILGEDDTFQGSFRGTIGHTFGHLVLSKKKIFFLREGSLGGADFEIRFEIPYADLNYNVLERNLMEIKDGSGKSWEFQTSMMAKFVEVRLNDLCGK